VRATQPSDRASSDALHRVDSLPPCVTHLQGGPHPHHTASSSPLLFSLPYLLPASNGAAEKEPRGRPGSFPHDLGPQRPSHTPPRPSHDPRAVARRREVRPWRREVLLFPLSCARRPSARVRAAAPHPRAAALQPCSGRCATAMFRSTTLLCSPILGCY
jgi:hypothetical protein